MEAGMIGYAEAPRAWGMAQRMSQAIGLNLAGAVFDGWLKRSEMSELVARCAACPQDAICSQWLASHVRARALPQFCGNKQAIESLAP
jgi:Family of unknown function (DUF6455)